MKETRARCPVTKASRGTTDAPGCADRREPERRVSSSWGLEVPTWNSSSTGFLQQVTWGSFRGGVLGRDTLGLNTGAAVVSIVCQGISLDEISLWIVRVLLDFPLS